MVDLVKIRKKAKEQKHADSAEPVTDSHDSAAPPPGAEQKKSKPASAGKTSSKKRKTTGKASRKPEKEPEGEAPPEERVVEDVPASEEPSEPQVAVKDETGSTKEAQNKLSEFKRTAGVMESAKGEELEEEAVESGVEQLELITFVLAGEQYAIEVDQLVEIIVPRRWTRVPNADETVIGIISLRGSIVTLIDLRRLLGHPGRGEETEDTRVIVVRNENEQVGFIVDRVLRVVKVDEASIEPHPVVSSSEHDEAVKGVFVSGDTITIYLDLERISG